MNYKKFFTLSFDDGVEHDKRVIALMKKHGLSGTFNLNAGMLGHKPRLANISRIPKDEIKQVYEGFEVASHGYNHEVFRFLSQKKTAESISKDLKELSGLLGYNVVGHAYPYAMYTKKAEASLRKNGVIYGRWALGKGSFCFPENPFKYMPTCWFNDKNVFNLIDDFIKAEPEDEHMLFMMWGHAYELEYGVRRCPAEQLERIFSRIAGQPDIAYCTNKEAFESVSL
ncbi:MAG: polysaccharide deacetylase family protein [Lachnospiraceae bacterium]|nr:polysaccharide deacetylase family protein [Lachnospiraceae bacterium]